MGNVFTFVFPESTVTVMLLMTKCNKSCISDISSCGWRNLQTIQQTTVLSSIFWKDDQSDGNKAEELSYEYSAVHF